jgi:hypothetical protein
VARTPKKLIKLLKEGQKVPASIVDSNLKIIGGSALDLEVLKELLSNNPAVLVSGLGPAPKFQFSWQIVTMDQPSLCTNMSNILTTALHELSQEGKLTTEPFIVTVSTTGLTKQRDVPWAFYALYKWLLHVPHVDKRAMEETLIAEALSESSTISGYSSVRASLLTDGEKRSSSDIQTGWVKHDKDVDFKAGPGPAIGYFISRATVGGFIFEKFIEGNAAEWNRKMITVTN